MIYKNNSETETVQNTNPISIDPLEDMFTEDLYEVYSAYKMEMRESNYFDD